MIRLISLLPLFYGKPPFERDAERDTKNAIAGLQYSFPSGIEL